MLPGSYLKISLLSSSASSILFDVMQSRNYHKMSTKQASEQQMLTCDMRSMGAPLSSLVLFAPCDPELPVPLASARGFVGLEGIERKSSGMLFIAFGLIFTLSRATTIDESCLLACLFVLPCFVRFP